MRSRLPGTLAIAVLLASFVQASDISGKRAAGTIPTVLSTWGYSSFSPGIGLSGILVARPHGHSEVFCAGEIGFDYWYALRYDPPTSSFVQTFVSERMPSRIVRIGSADVDGDGEDEFVVAMESGELRFYDPASKRQRGSFTIPSFIAAMALHDLDGDGKAEIILTCGTGLVVYSGDGSFLWSLNEVFGTDLAVGQMDDDPSLEIAATDGKVVDVATQTVQWTWPDGFGAHLRAADIDGDGRDEIVSADQWYFVWAFDVETQLPKWSITTSQDIGALEVADADCDGKLEVLVGQDQWGSILAFDPLTKALKWQIANPEHGITAIAVGDAAGDGRLEVLWGAGATSSGPDYLYAADPSTQAILWQNADLVGPFIGPEVGDVDGDGEPEIVFASSESNASYSSGRIIVLDGKTRRLRAISDPIADNGSLLGIRDLKLRNVDGDAALEIVIGTDFLYNGRIEIYKFDGATNTFTRIWKNPDGEEGAPFASVEVADVDLDGQLDIVGGGSRAHTGALGVFITVFNYPAGDVKWQTFQLGPYWGEVRDVAVLTAGGGNPDVVGVVPGDALYAFDGPTGDPLQIDPDSFTSLRADPYAPGRSILLGTDRGDVIRYGRGASKYISSATYTLGVGAVDGVTTLSGGGALVGAEGVLRFYTSLDGTASWQSAEYGAPFGRVVARGAGVNQRFFSGGLYGLHEIAPGLDLVSVSPSSGPAAGGTALTVTGTAFQPSASLFVGDAVASDANVGGPTGIQATTPALPAGSLLPVTVINPDASIESLEEAFVVDFSDVAAAHPFHDAVETIFRRHVTAGCGSGNFCAPSPVTRAQMAVFLVRAADGASFQPPQARGHLFSDVSCGDFGANEIEWIATQGITAGCGGGAYCVSAPVTRAQMAVFLLKTLEGSAYAPPPAHGIFADVPASDPFAPWIEDLSARGITAGCGGGNFCPGDATTRGQMAVFLTRTFFTP